MSVTVLREQRFDDAVLLFGTAVGVLDDLAAEERALLSPRATEKRRHDFIAGRLLAKEALRRALGPADYVIGRDTGLFEGAPLVAGAHVSISHVDGFVCAIASKRQVSVDLVKVEQLSEAFCEEAFTALERRVWAASGDACVMSLAFAAKEAALKWLRTGMGTALHDVEVLPRRHNTIDLCTRAGSTTLACATLTHEAWLSFVLYDGNKS